MMYWTWLKKKKEQYVFRDQILPGIIPDHVFDLMVCDVVKEQLGLCELCDVHGARCHVIEEDTGRKFCPVLFVDVVRPPWKVKDLC
jgi:hypothetical protein